MQAGMLAVQNKLSFLDSVSTCVNIYALLAHFDDMDNKHTFLALTPRRMHFILIVSQTRQQMKRAKLAFNASQGA
jgi:hypothetical protein